MSGLTAQLLADAATNGHLDELAVFLLVTADTAGVGLQGAKEHPATEKK